MTFCIVSVGCRSVLILKRVAL